ncbi:MAG: ABC transporter permease [Treponema sp.]|nr:ABC transporter permease [Treponema sp.]
MTFRSCLLYAGRLVFSRPTADLEVSYGRRSLVGALVCIGISLVPLVSVLVIGDGMIEGITGRMIGLSSQHLCVYADYDSPCAKNLETFESLADRIAAIDGVTGVFPEVRGMALAAGASSRSGATVRAVRPGVFTQNEAFATLFSVVEGNTDLSEPDGVVIGKKIAELLGVHAGGRIRLITVSKNKAGRILPKVTAWTVRGIVSSGYQELDALWVFMPLDRGFSMLPERDSQYLVGVQTADAFSQSLYRVASRVKTDLYGMGGASRVAGTSVYLWNELNVAEYENFASTKALLLIIMLLIVMVASVNICSALVMLVIERRREIAILKSVGGSAHGVAAAFLLAGFAAGLGGVLVGIPLGLLAAVNINTIVHFMEKTVNLFAKFLYLLKNGDGELFSEIHLLDPAYYLQEIPVSVPLVELCVIALGTLLLSLVMSAIPAVKAGREKPLDTLRKV